MELTKVNSNQIIELISDTRNIQYHQKIISKSTKIVKRFPGIEAILLSGSFATESADVFSDIDFKVAFDPSVTSPKIISETYIGKMDQIGRVINIFNSTANSKDKIIYFFPFLKFELNMRTTDNLSRSRKNANSKVLFEKDDIGKKIINNAQEKIFNLDNYREYIQNISIAFPNLCYIIMGYVIRGELITAFSDLNWIRELLLEINGYMLQKENEGPRRAEKRFSKITLDYYNDSATIDEAKIKDALIILLKWYLDVLVPLFEINNIETRRELATEIINVITKTL